jgi:hypothetical protein
MLTDAVLQILNDRGLLLRRMTTPGEQNGPNVHQTTVSVVSITYVDGYRSIRRKRMDVYEKQVKSGVRACRMRKHLMTTKKANQSRRKPRKRNRCPQKKQ